jgi:hypothetical protein
MSKVKITIVLMSIVALLQQFLVTDPFILFPFTSAQPGVGTDNNCVNNTAMPSNYLTLTCDNSLIKTNDTITNLNCGTSSGWFIVCIWLQQINGSTPTWVSIASSQDGGQSFNDPLIDLGGGPNSARNPEVGLAQEFAYIKWEQEVSLNNSDILFAVSSDGGMTFDEPLNISNSTFNSINSTLVVDQLTGKYLVSWIEQGDDEVKVYCGRC